MRDHGGNLDAAIARYGGGAEDWIDLSTGINPRPYPVPAIPPRAWSALPTAAEIEALSGAAAAAYGSALPPLPVAGAQAAIGAIPRLLPPRRARVLSPTYNEHAATLEAAGWRVEPVAERARLAGAELAVVVNPNNPDGARHDPAALAALAGEVGLLVVDESFADTDPALSMAGHAGDGVIVLRSFGKFYGLAGLRLGFVIAGDRMRTALGGMFGPWPVSGPAIAIGRAALADTGWQRQTVARLREDAARLDRLAGAAGWHLAGGTALFRLYDTGDAAAARDRLARRRIWSRSFPGMAGRLRLGLPDGADQWRRLAAALGD